MRQQLIDDITIALMSVVDDNVLEDIKMRLTIILSKYEISKAETAIVKYDGDINDRIIKRFLASKIAAGLSKRTIEYYKQTITFFFGYCNKPFNEVISDDIRLYLAMRISRDGITKTTANNERRNISSFYGWLQKEEILLKNPMAKIDALKETKKKKKAYSLMDLEKIRHGCRTAREKAMVEFLASTWCRVSEMLEVKVSDIKGDRLEVHGKGDKYRTVYLNARAMLALQEYLKERNDNSPYLFPGCAYKATQHEFKEALKKHDYRKAEWYKVQELVSMDGIPDVSIIENTIRQIGRRTGVENVHPHRFRRTGATMALRQGMPITTVSKLLGHESIETTQIYLDISDEELEQMHKKYVV
jgi:site-specific recombinase XerD